MRVLLQWCAVLQSITFIYFSSLQDIYAFELKLCVLIFINMLVIWSFLGKMRVNLPAKMSHEITVLAYSKL